MAMTIHGFSASWFFCASSLAVAIGGLLLKSTSSNVVEQCESSALMRMRQYIESGKGGMEDCLEAHFAGCWEPCRLAGMAFMFSVGILMQILGCALYNNWWPMLSALMYVMVPMPCLFFGGGSSTDFISMSSVEGEWLNVAKFLTGFSSVGSIAIPAILHHAKLIEMGAMLLALFSFGILVCTVILFQKANQEDDTAW